MSKEIKEYIDEDVIDYFNINEKLDVVRSFSDDDTSYPSYIKDIDSGKIIMDYISKGGVTVALHAGKEITVYLYKEDGVLKGHSRVIEVIKDGKTGVAISPPEWLERTQRRAFMRWKSEFPVTLYNMKGNEVVDKIEYNSFAISGCGMSIITKKPVLKDWMSIVAEFKFENLTIKTPVKFVHAYYLYSERSYIVGLEFLAFDNQKSNELHKAIVKQQLDFRRKGII